MAQIMMSIIGLTISIIALAIGITCLIGESVDARRLRHLRRNCFLTNERGHRVRYWNASESVRERAEG